MISTTTQPTALPQVKRSLHQALKALGPLPECILLDYPANYNIGDHLIWLGTLFYLTRVTKTRIRYAASATDCSDTALAKTPDAPILFQGGGNLGDLWPQFQHFRERIIAQNPHRQIAILPQSIYFKNPQNLERAAAVFNNHPNLTIFVRDRNSYRIATQHFNQCQIIECPDMAFQMVDLPGMRYRPNNDDSILYLYRQDKEKNSTFRPEALGLDTLTQHLIVQDWDSFSWMNKLPPNWPYIPGIVRLVREGWQRGLSNPGAWLSRQHWERLHPHSRDLRSVYHPALHLKSWGMMHSGIQQLSQHRLVVTNRLHVHILCTLMGIPHVLLPGSYSKIPDFYEAWTKALPHCHFVNSPDQVKDAALSLF